MDESSLINLFTTVTRTSRYIIHFLYNHSGGITYTNIDKYFLRFQKMLKYFLVASIPFLFHIFLYQIQLLQSVNKIQLRIKDHSQNKCFIFKNNLSVFEAVPIKSGKVKFPGFRMRGIEH